MVMDELEMAEPKTKEMVALLGRLGIEDSVLVLLPEANANVELSARNLPEVKTLRAGSLSVRDLLGYDSIVMLLGSVDMIHSMLGVAE